MPTSPGCRNQTRSCFVHRCKLNLPASSAGGVVAAQAQIQSQSLTVHREDKGSEEWAVHVGGSGGGGVCMGRVFLNTVVADTCPHPKADLSDVRERSSGTQAANHTAVKKEWQHWKRLHHWDYVKWNFLWYFLPTIRNTFMPTVKVKLQYFDTAEHI